MESKYKNYPYLKSKIIDWYKEKALDILADRVSIYKEKIAIPKKISIKTLTARWGSCNSKGELVFNWKLILAPLPVIDYVVIHELSHLKELNHSKHFWMIVAQIMPDYKKHIKWLKNNGHTLDI